MGMQSETTTNSEVGWWEEVSFQTAYDGTKANFSSLVPSPPVPRVKISIPLTTPACVREG